MNGHCSSQGECACKPERVCKRCDGRGWYWRTPDGFNPFLAGGFRTADVMYKAPCSCAGRAALEQAS